MLFSGNAISESPISDDESFEDRLTSPFVVIIYFNKVVKLALAVNYMQHISLAFNNLNAFSLSKNILNTISLNKNILNSFSLNKNILSI